MKIRLIRGKVDVVFHIFYKQNLNKQKPVQLKTICTFCLLMNDYLKNEGKLMFFHIF